MHVWQEFLQVSEWLFYQARQVGWYKKCIEVNTLKTVKIKCFNELQVKADYTRTVVSLHYFTFYMFSVNTDFLIEK